SDLGGELKRRERLSARLGDMLSFLYLASACLKHFHDQGEPEEDLPLLCWGVEDLLVRIEQAMHEVLLNFPDRSVGMLLRVLIFPLGRDRKSTRLNSSHVKISYAVFCLKKKKTILIMSWPLYTKYM